MIALSTIFLLFSLAPDSELSRSDYLSGILLSLVSLLLATFALSTAENNIKGHSGLCAARLALTRPIWRTLKATHSDENVKEYRLAEPWQNVTNAGEMLIRLGWLSIVLLPLVFYFPKLIDENVNLADTYATGAIGALLQLVMGVLLIAVGRRTRSLPKNSPHANRELNKALAILILGGGISFVFFGGPGIIPLLGVLVAGRAKQIIKSKT